MVTSDGAGGNLRVKRPSEPVLDTNSTVSEGIGYGMIVAVFMGDQTTFDGLWKYEQAHLDENGLMNWYLLASGDLGMNGGGGATDADEDMAFALLMADKQWGGKGSLADTYYNYAKKQIAAIWLHEVVDSKLAGPGDHWADQWNNINISYFAPSYYRLFQKVTVTDTPGWPSGAPAPDWNAVMKTAYDTIDFALKPDFGNQNNGLVPAWCASHDPICSPRDSAANYQYDSCRTPFRIGLDWCWNGEARAQAYVTKTSNFFSGLGGVANIADGYALNGNPQPANPGKGSAAFVGPAAVGAMSAATYRTFLDQAYTAVATRQLLAGGTYYEESWTVMSLLMMTGNFIDYTRY
jgi:endo-1,4-beta-D-glucanase Y